MSLLKVSDNYSATIVGNFSTTATTITVDIAPVKTAGYLTVFDLNGNQFEKIKYAGVTGLDLTGCIRGLSFDDNSDTPVSGNAKELKNGMAIKMTVSQHYINPIFDVLNGDTASAGVIKNPAARVISDSRHLVDKEYADAISSAGIMAMLVTDAGGVTIDINSGTYILNGVVKTYAGVAGQALTDNATNYVQIKDGTLDIPTDAFDDDAIPLATVICASADITSLVDNRPFYTGVDVKADSGLGRDANGIFIDLGTDPGLEFSVDGLEAKIKSAGGLVKDADGLSVDSSKVNVLTTMPAYESLVAGDLLKTINDAGTYKVKKIVGIGSELSGTSASSFSSGCIVKELDTNKIIIVHGKDSNAVKVQVGTISGATITFGAEQELKTSTEMSIRQLPYTVEVLSTTRFVVTYLDKNSTTSISIFAKVCTVSGVTITPGSEQTILTVTTNTDFGGIVSTQIATDKIAYFFMYTSGNNNGYTIVSTVSGDAITSGSIVSVEGTVSLDILGIAKLDTDKYIVTYQYPSSYLYRYAICTAAGTVATAQTPVTIATGGSGNTITMQAVLQAGTNAGIFVYNLSGASGTLILSYFTVSATTLTVAGSTSINSMLGTAMTLGSQWVAKVGNFIYVKSHSDSKMLKFSYDTTGKFTYIISGSSIVSGIEGNPGTVLANGSIIICSDWSTTAFKAIIFLLDHDEFVTSANASYSVDGNVPINTDIYTGFSGLLNGVDYYINSGATGLTVLSTFKKVGKAINATSILKS